MDESIWKRNERLLGAYLDLCNLIGIEPKEFEATDYKDLRQQVGGEFSRAYVHCLRNGIDVSAVEDWMMG